MAFIDAFLACTCSVATWNSALFDGINGGFCCSDNMTQGLISSALSGLDFRIKDRESFLYCMKVKVPTFTKVLSEKLAVTKDANSAFFSCILLINFVWVTVGQLGPLHTNLINWAGLVSEISRHHSFLHKNVDVFIWEVGLAQLLRSCFLQPRSW